MKKIYFALVERTEKWDQSLDAQHQPGFAEHAAYMGTLEANGFIAMAGILNPSDEVLFIFRAQSEAEVREKLALDPWLSSGQTKLIRLEEAQFRIGAPAGVATD